MTCPKFSKCANYKLNDYICDHDGKDYSYDSKGTSCSNFLDKSSISSK